MKTETKMIKDRNTEREGASAPSRQATLPSGKQTYKLWSTGGLSQGETWTTEEHNGETFLVSPKGWDDAFRVDYPNELSQAINESISRAKSLTL